MAYALPAWIDEKIMPVPFSGCWLWMGGIKGRNRSVVYGSFSRLFAGKKISAHRALWTLAFGEVPEGLCVLHKCDVSLCVNPDHLFLGTQLDNIADRTAKGRTAQGPSHHFTKRSACPAGHAYTPENTKIKSTCHKGRRGPNKVCRICYNLHRRKYRYNARMQREGRVIL